MVTENIADQHLKAEALVNALADAMTSRAVVETRYVPSNRDEAETIRASVLSKAGLDLNQPGVGWKLGASNHASRNALSMEEPFWGALPSAHVLGPRAHLKADQIRQRRVEAEIAVTLGPGLLEPGQTYTATQAWRAVASVHCALEIPQSRFSDLNSEGPLALLADNGAAGWAIIGDPHPPASWTFSPAIHAQLKHGDHVLAEGTGAALIAPPDELLADHLNRITAQGHKPAQNQVVLLGALTPCIDLPLDQKISAEISSLGEVSILVESC